MNSAEHPRIVRTPGVIGGKARIDGTRWPVWMAWARCVEGNETAEDIQADFPSLSLAEINAAIDYARENWLEVHADFDRAQAPECDWCGAPMRSIARATTGMGKGHFWVWHCTKCHHEVER